MREFREYDDSDEFERARKGMTPEESEAFLQRHRGIRESERAEILRNIGINNDSEPKTREVIDHNEVYRLCVEEGVPLLEAARHFGYKSKKPLIRILKEHGWKTPMQQKLEIEIDPDEVYQLYNEKGMSLIQIAEHYGFSSKDPISKLFKKKKWIPRPLSARETYEFPSDIHLEHRIPPSAIAHSFESLQESDNVSTTGVVKGLEKLHSSLISEKETRKKNVYWFDLNELEWFEEIAKEIQSHEKEVEEEVNSLLESSGIRDYKIRVGTVSDKFYLRYQDLSEYNWMNIYKNEVVYFESSKEKNELIAHTKARLGLTSDLDLGELVDQLTDREKVKGDGYSCVKEHAYKTIRAETLHLLIDTTGITIQEIQDSIECVGKKKGEKGGIFHPRFLNDPEEIDLMFAKFFGAGLSDGHLDRAHSSFIYCEKNPERREIVMEHSKDFGDVRYTIKPNSNQIQFPAVFGRMLENRGFPAGDKTILNEGLPDFIKLGSLKVQCCYFCNMWVEDGCFSIEQNIHGTFSITRSVRVYDPKNGGDYELEAEITPEHIALFHDFGKKQDADEEYGFGEFLILTPNRIHELCQSEDSEISKTALSLRKIVYENPDRLLTDESLILEKLGIHAPPFVDEVLYFTDTCRISVCWRVRIRRNRDVMKIALLMPPDDIRKRTVVERWANMHPELKAEVEREIEELKRKRIEF